MVLLGAVLCGCASPTPAPAGNATVTPIPEPDRTNAIQNAVEIAHNYVLLHSPNPVDEGSLKNADVDAGIWSVTNGGYYSTQFIDVRMNFASNGYTNTSEVIVLWTHDGPSLTVNYADVNGEAI